MELADIKRKISNNCYRYSQHAILEAQEDDLSFTEIEEALLKAEILENYPNTGRGESVLLLGFANDKPIHVVLGDQGDELVIITVYIPEPPKFLDPWTRNK